MNTDIHSFIQELGRQEMAPRTTSNYLSDLACFARWFQSSTGEPFSPSAVSPTDIRDYRAYLMTVENRKPSTVNRRLAALRKFFQWAKATGRVHDVPTESAKGGKGDASLSQKSPLPGKSGFMIYRGGDSQGRGEGVNYLQN